MSSELLLGLGLPKCCGEGKGDTLLPAGAAVLAEADVAPALALTGFLVGLTLGKTAEGWTLGEVVDSLGVWLEGIEERKLDAAARICALCMVSVNIGMELLSLLVTMLPLAEPIVVRAAAMGSLGLVAAVIAPLACGACSFGADGIGVDADADADADARAAVAAAVAALVVAALFFLFLAIAGLSWAVKTALIGCLKCNDIVKADWR